MIKSMTGYGRSSVVVAGRNLSVELRLLNSKQMDVSLKIPGFMKEKEFDIRNLISLALDRGKAELIISAGLPGETGAPVINRALAASYHAGILALSKELEIQPPDDILSVVLRMPDVLTTGQEVMTPEDWELLYTSVREAISQADRFRAEEGKALENDLLQRVHLILQYLDSVGIYEAPRITVIREKIQRELARYASGNGNPPIDQNRFEQELIYFFEKLDITEEKVRLLRHCEYFLETMNEPGSQGKKLGFIAQEMGREINTIGSKASDADIQKIVVQMKDELEKIKEQINNIL